MQRLIADLRYALRALRKSPGFTLAAVFTLALGIGATTAVFSVVRHVLLQPLPYADPGSLVLIWQRTHRSPAGHVRVPAPDVADFQDRASRFSGFAFVGSAFDAAIGSGAADPGPAARIGVASANLFSLLGVSPQVGRLFRPGTDALPAPPPTPDDTAAARAPVSVVLSHAFWHARFGGDSTVIGRTILANNQSMIVLGVLPPEFRVAAPAGAGVTTAVDAWIPLGISLRAFARDPGTWQDQDSDNRGMVIGRLRSGVTLDQARSQMERIAAQQRREIPFYARAGMGLDVLPMHRDVVGSARTTLLALLGLVGVVLLIACLNVANLLLARAMDRQPERALRAALGASRAGLVRQAALESGLLALGGGVTGVLLARWGVEWLAAVAPATLAIVREARIDAPVLGFTLFLSLGALLMFGLVPAWRAALDRSEMWRSAGRSGSGRREHGLRRSLVVAQVALSLPLLTATGLLVQSLLRLQSVRPGFEPAGVLTFNLTLPPGSIGGPAERAGFMHRAAGEIGRLPGVTAVGVIGGLPLGGEQWTQPYGPGTQPPAEWGEREARFRPITSGYFRAMGIPLLEGRGFTDREDRVEAERVAVVDAALARQLEPGGHAVGLVLGFPLDGHPVRARIVGVAGSVRSETLREDARPTIYVPYRQEASRSVSFAVRAGPHPLDLAGPVQRRIAALGGLTAVPVHGFRALERYVADDLAPTRFASRAVTAFAGIALGLAMVGLYGLLAYAVSRRLRELGVRLAVGASPASLLRTTMAGGLRLVATGLVIGGLLALAGTRLLYSLLFGITPGNPWNLALASAVLLAAALPAIWLPARRAMRVDPMNILREN